MGRARAAALRYEPIVTLNVASAGTPAGAADARAALRQHAARPVQFVFDQGQLGGAAGVLTLVISGAAPWVERGTDATSARRWRSSAASSATRFATPPRLLQALTDKRATFRCTPGLRRPAMQVADRLFAAGDYVDGPYPATLEGAVRSGLAAARAA